VPGIALDTNVLAYAEGVERAPDDAAKILVSRRLMREFDGSRTKSVIAVQALAELHNVLVTRSRVPPPKASAIIRLWIDRAEIVETSAAVLGAALELTAAHHVPIFDAIILAAAVEGRCDFLLSEDFQEGFAWRGVVVANPFAAAPHPRLVRLLSL